MNIQHINALVHTLDKTAAFKMLNKLKGLRGIPAKARQTMYNRGLFKDIVRGKRSQAKVFKDVVEGRAWAKYAPGKLKDIATGKAQATKAVKQTTKNTGQMSVKQKAIDAMKAKYQKMTGTAAKAPGVSKEQVGQMSEKYKATKGKGTTTTKAKDTATKAKSNTNVDAAGELKGDIKNFYQKYKRPIQMGGIGAGAYALGEIDLN